MSPLKDYRRRQTNLLFIAPILTAANYMYAGKVNATGVWLFAF